MIRNIGICSSILLACTKHIVLFVLETSVYTRPLANFSKSTLGWCIRKTLGVDREKRIHQAPG